MQPLNILNCLQTDMVDYVSSKYPFLERGMTDLHHQLIAIMSKQGTLFQDPVLQLVRSRKNQKFDWSTFHQSLQPKTSFDPYIHQIKAWNNIAENIPTVVATGTGSGKSESFMFPMLDGLIKQGFAGKRKIGAVCLYPMNALVEDQYGRLQELSKHTGLKVGIYNGSYKNKEGAVDVNNPETIPNILLTNYKMLEYMLLRSKDHILFEDIDLKYLVLDEAHTYTGTLGLEIACLLGRLRVHLGSGAKNFTPIATSATLMSQSDDQDVSTGQEEMRQFFSKLFGVPFPKDKPWLIEDEYEDLLELDKTLFNKVCHPNVEAVKAAVDGEFPAGLWQLAKLYFNLDLNFDQNLGVAENYDHWAKLLLPHCETVAKQIPGVILRGDDAETEDSVVKLAQACERFSSRLGLDPYHLKALLILCSQAYQNRKFPTLGLRVHVFGKSEPRIFWSFDKKRIYDESQVENAGKAASDYISCTKCGHSAWAGIFVPNRGVSGEEGELKRLPLFYENAELPNGEEMVVLHNPDDFSEEIFERKEWKAERWQLDSDDPSCGIKRLSGKAKVSPGARELIRVIRTGDKGIADDTRSCPACGATAGQNTRPVILTPRSGVATNISVYGASLMSATDIPEERRLLVFCDNRQETAFLAGFLSDRHRRFNIRRVVASFLKEAGDKHEWQLYKSVDEDDPLGHKYDLAARILLSAHHKEYWGDKALPKKSPMISKDLLQDLIPRDILEVDWLDQNDPQQKVNNEYKNWLLGNVSLDKKHQDAKEVFNEVELFKTERGHWVLRMFSDVLLIELSSMIAREGSLQSLGLASWYIKGLEDDTAFEQYAESNPDLKVGARGLKYISYWLLNKLAMWGQWRGLDESSRRHALGRKGRAKMATLTDIVSKSLDKTKPMSKNSKIARILEEFGGDDAIKEWSKSKTWLTLIENGPLEKFIAINEQMIPRIKTGKLRVVNNPKTYRGKRSGEVRSAAATIDLGGLPTGRKGDHWELVTLAEHPYYKALYQRSFNEEFRLVRASEHNGMISGDRATQIIEDFKNQKLNALVATPTLEMGVDLPDLPVVIHRSVPPDPSNYAQRAGRAGRDPKRALVVTHCGFGSHDLTFYENPKEMVSGEILPPGLPNENMSILKRHIQGLVLELLAIDDGSFKSKLSFNWWGELVDLKDLKNQYLEVVGVDQKDGLPDMDRIVKWEDILTERKDYVAHKVNEYVELMAANLWDSLEENTRNSLKRKAIQAGQVDSWGQSFKEQLDRYLLRAKLHIEDLRTLLQKERSVNSTKENELRKQFNRANMLARMFLTSSENNYPLSYLGANGFLPNFDFPGKVVRFVGVLPEYANKDSNRVSAKDKYLSFSRAAAVALREFAPEQSIYGQGFIYKVDRYITEGLDKNDGKAWGICERGCSELTPPGEKHCQFCEGDLIRANEEGVDQPRLLEVQEVHGMQEAVISDQQSKREFNPVVKEVRRLGMPFTDKSYDVNELKGFGWDLYLNVDQQIQSVTFLRGKTTETADSFRIDPLYKERDDGENKVFTVKTSVPAKELGQWEPFIPAVFSESQGLRVSAPYARASEYGLIEDYGLTLRSLKTYFETLVALLQRSSTRVLRLNKRKGSLNFIVDKTNRPGDEILDPKSKILILDNEEGGSGIIDLIWHYWDQIMAEAGRIVEQECCQSTCYRCLKSYDNQGSHDLLDKSIFNIDGKTPFFDRFRKRLGSQQNYSDRSSGEQREVDKNSPAEKVLEDYLKDNYPLHRSTQKSRFTFKGKEITRPDFVVHDHREEEVIVFVDGYQYHGDAISMLGDIEKRNHLTFQGSRTLTLPGALFVEKVNRSLLDALFRPLLDSDISIDVPFEEKTMSRLEVAVEGETLHRIGKYGPKNNRWKAIKSEALKQSLGASELVKDSGLIDRFSELEDRDMPLAVQDDYLLFPIHGVELTDEGNKKRWESCLLMHSLFASLGYRVVYLWIGHRISKAG